MKKSMRRYTELPFVVDLLRTKQLALLSPTTWDDSNDAFYVEEYQVRKGLYAVGALCFAEAVETYHHWRVFASGSGGVCIQFDKETLIQAAKKVPGLRAERVKYRTLSNLRSGQIQSRDLPFLKRHPFKDEREVRFILDIRETQPLPLRFPIPLECVERITLSPWLPRTVADQVKETLKSIDGCRDLRIYHSTLVDNEEWKRLARSTPG